MAVRNSMHEVGGVLPEKLLAADDGYHRPKAQRNKKHWKSRNKNVPQASGNREKGSIARPAKGLYLKKSRFGWGAQGFCICTMFRAASVTTR